MEKFRKLGIGEKILKAVAEHGFTDPSEIQEKAIPLVMEGKDIIGGSATGTGKTFAFGAGIIEKMERGKGVQSLVLTPTRELCEQVASSLRKFSKYHDIRVKEIYGGVGITDQVYALRETEIVVGTPGRILDHLERRTIDLKHVKILVLDEADRMLDMGFIDDVLKIISQCPKQRQTLLFSATISSDIDHIAKKYMNNPVNIHVESYVDASKLKQVYYDVEQNVKFSLLVHLLRKENPGLIMVFCNTRHNADFIANNLKRYDIDAIAIHGGLSQNKRDRVMDLFKSNRIGVLVCTDIAARGLDIKGVSHVYNYDLPKTSEEYVHRIGRTARAGKEGIAVNIVSPRDYENFRRVLGNDDLKIEQVDVPEMEFVKPKFQEERREFRGRGFGGGRFGGRGRDSGRGYSRGRFGRR